MADFDSIYTGVQSYEGDYSNDPHDRGGETYKGIARNFHGDWEGWNRIDSEKHDSNFPTNLEWDLQLQYSVKEFYKNNYFYKFQGHKLLDNVAERLFNATINVGLKTGVEFFQCALNILNNNQKLYKDIDVDGIFGSQTYEAYLHCIALRGSSLLTKVLGFYQAKYYIELMEQNGVNERWIGWFNRI